MNIKITVELLAALLLASASPAEEPAASARPAAQPPIQVSNYKDGEVIRYPVPLIRGVLADAAADSITVTNTSSHRGAREMKGLVHKGRFKVLAELVPGVNKLVLRAGKDELPLAIEYKPQTNSYVVRAIYLTDNTGATDYQTPIPNDPQDYSAKMDTMMKLIQTFTAERLNDLGFGRATFNLELDDQGKVKVHVFKCAAPAGTYYAMNGMAWWGNVGGQLERQFPTRKAKNLVVAAYTRYDPETRKVKGTTALGGGCLALFGSQDMFTWPSTLADAQPAFMNATMIDTAKVMSDSVGRHTFWAAASTTIGVCLHELSHTFGLPHSHEAMDIMTRGFDQFNRAFTFMDPPSAGNKKPIEFPDNRVACFPPISAAALVPCRWLALDDRQYDDRAEIGVHLDQQSRNLIVESDKDLCYIGFSAKGDADWFAVPPADQRRRMSFDLADLTKRLKTDQFSIRIINDQWVIKNESSSTLLAGPFVERWQFAAITEPWHDTKAFVKLSPERRKEIEKSALAAAPVTSGSGYVDFLPRFPEGKQAFVAAYTARVIKTDKARKIKLLTGSDDALRVWLNGKPVQEVLALRGAVVDTESCTAELQAGDNTLLVEVSQGNGGWGLYLRIEDSDGKKLRLSDDGTLADAASKERVFNVRTFGATGDGVTLDTKSVQAAIAACHASGGGIVELPQGSYHVGTLEMLSNVTLKLNDGATLLGSQSLGDYAADVGGLAEEPAFQKCLIHAENATNVGFEGTGTIDGRGSMRAFPVKVDGKVAERPSLMRLANCQRVRFSGLTFKNPASWGLHLVGCQDVRFNGVTIHSRDNNTNNDGIDLDGCRDVLVENCRINSGDDAVCLKSTLPQPCSNIVVRSCQLSSKTAGFKLGTSSRSGFVDIRLETSRLHDCPMGAVKLLLVDGGRLENVTLERLTMENVGGPIFIRLGNRGRLYDKPAAQIYGKDVRPEGAPVGVIRGVTIKKVTARVTGKDRDRQAIMITGIPGHRVQDVTLEDINVRFPGGGTRDDAMRQVPEDIARYPEQYFFGVLPAWGLFVRHADGIRLRNIKLDCDAADARPPVFLEDVSRWDTRDVLINGRQTNVAAPLDQPQK